MVGTPGTKVGALQAAPARLVEQATEYALALITGWAKGEKDKFSKILSELNTAAKHNQVVYGQASDALNELSRKNEELRKLQATVAAAKQEAETLAARVQSDVATKRSEMQIERDEFETARRSHTKSVEEWNASLKQRVDAVVKREKAVEAREGEQARYATQLESFAAQAKALKESTERKFNEVCRVLGVEPPQAG